MRAFVRTHWVGVIIVVVLSATVAQGAVRSPQDDLPAAQAPTSEPEFDWVTQAPQADGKQAKLQAKQQAKQEQENADPRLDALKTEAGPTSTREPSSRWLIWSSASASSASRRSRRPSI